MKHKMVPVIVFALLFSAGFAACEWTARRIFETDATDREFTEHYQGLASGAAHGVRTVIFGNSHMQSAWLASASRTPSFKMARTSQDLSLDLELLEKYGPSLTDVNQVVLGVSYFSFGYRLQDFEKSILVNYRSLGIHPDDWILRLKTELMTRSRFLRYRSIFVRRLTQRLVPGIGSGSDDPRTSPLSRFNRLSESEQSAWSRRRSLLHFSGIYSPDAESRNREALTELIRKSRERGWRVLIVTPPVTSNYRDRLPPDAAERAHRMIRSAMDAAAGGANVVYYDFAAKQVYGDQMFMDPDHLNVYGARRFTQDLNRALEELNNRPMRSASDKMPRYDTIPH